MHFPASCSLSEYELQEESRNLEEEPEAAGKALAFYWIINYYLLTPSMQEMQLKALHHEGIKCILKT